MIVLSRVPFLFSGYGLDGDSWAVVLSARSWSDTGVYEASRFPGYPVHEFLTRLFVSGHYFSLNFLTAIISSLGILFFVMALREMKFRSSFLAGAALSCVPIIYIQSTTVIDYCIAMSFELMAFYYLIRGKHLLSGIFIGLAIGTRITSGAMLLPFIIMTLESDGIKRNLSRVVRLVIPALFIGAISFLPVYLRYGTSFLAYYEVPYPSVVRVLYKLFIEVWGVLGLFAILLSIILLFLPDRWKSGNYLFPRAVNAKYVVAWLVAIDLYIISFIKLPMESGYLIPIIPFVILLFGKFLVRPAFGLFCLLLIASPFFISVSPANRGDAVAPTFASAELTASNEKVYIDFLRGPVMTYELRRRAAMQYLTDVRTAADTFTHRAVLVTGQWYNPLVVLNGDSICGNVKMVSHIDEAQLLAYYAKGNELYFMDRQNETNLLVRGIDPELYGARPLFHSVKTSH